ncbi:hypothetical protein VISI1226_05054 [Vibrio sinaloensis DSM 21326]|uniref:Serine protease n=1 Tax=Vibrio sinaloensis DSM 21326 TaxID=945550 RepID=E8M1G5_PHOS4|nr:serine protease [Vibrio sinaloensis]EGA72145.1 hypothetical protein VISI1226_05054 [Vibrio sinaloensis DSM 21326]
MYRFLLLITLALTGCANGLPNVTADIEDDIEHDNEKIFVGIPFLLGLEGSVARLDDEWLVTAAHNKPILELTGKDVFYHPTCDIALIKNHGHTEHDVGLVFPGQIVTHIGYPLGLPISSSEGEYVGDVKVYGWDKCQMSGTTGVIMVGMSGGGVYNQAGELIGVNHGFVSGNVKWPKRAIDSPAVFVSLYAVRDWLSSITGREYFGKS